MHPAIKVFFAAALITTLSTLFVSSILYLPPRELELLRKADALRPTLRIPTVARDAMPHPDVHPLVGAAPNHQSNTSSLPVNASHLEDHRTSNKRLSHAINVKFNQKQSGFESGSASKTGPPSKESRAIARAIADAMLHLTERHSSLGSYASEHNKGDEDDEDDNDDEDDSDDEAHEADEDDEDDKDESSQQDDTDEYAASERNSPHTVQTAIDDPAIQSAITKLAKSAKKNERTQVQRVIHSSDTSPKIQDHPSNTVGLNDDEEVDSEDHDDDQDHNDPDGSAMRRAMDHLAEQRRVALAAQKNEIQSSKNTQGPTTIKEGIISDATGDKISSSEYGKGTVANVVTTEPVERRPDTKIVAKERKFEEIQTNAKVIKHEKQTKKSNPVNEARARPVTMEDAMKKLSMKFHDRSSQELRNGKVYDTSRQAADATNGNLDDGSTTGGHTKNSSARQRSGSGRDVTTNSKLEHKESPTDAMAKAMEQLAKRARV